MKDKDSYLLEQTYINILESDEDAPSCCGPEKKTISMEEIELRKQISAYAEEIKEYSNAISHPHSISLLCQTMENLNNVYKNLLDICDK